MTVNMVNCSGLIFRPLLFPSLVACHFLNESAGSGNTQGQERCSSGRIEVLLRGQVQPMEETLDDKPLFHTVVGAGGDVLLKSFPCLRHHLICELLEARDLVP